LEISLEEINKLIEDDINPMLSLHNGFAKGTEYDKDGHILFLELKGGCAGCPSSSITLYNGIVPILQEKFPEIEVILV